MNYLGRQATDGRTLMTRNTLLAIMVSAAALFGCATKTTGATTAPAGSATPAATPAAMPPPPGPLVCGLSTTRGNTCERKGNRLICHVYVGGTVSAPFAYPYGLLIPTTPTNVVIVWHLLDQKAVFRDKNDGPNLPAPNFTDGDTTDDSDGSSTNGGEAKNYRVKFKNTALGGGVHYTIKFNTESGLPTECDPTIGNLSN
jgi:hypothetical protein